ncbi:MAG: ParA family protein [Saprospiraceae bacterium]|nr:ParA family protein [Saprospiraceae bacterium]
MKIISIAIQKGGAGKTTTTLNLAAALREAGKTCLLVDLDPQAGLSQSLGIHDEPFPNTYHLLKREAAGIPGPPEDAIIEKSGLDLIPASLELASAELELVSVYGREHILAQVLQRLERRYDFALLDCPPSIGMLTVNALVASDAILMPLTPEFLSLRGAKSFLRHLELVRRLNARIDLLGLVLTRYDARKTMTREVEAQLLQDYGRDKVFTTCIRTSIALAKAQRAGTDIFSFDKNANGAKDYRALAAEFLSKIGSK